MISIHMSTSARFESGLLRRAVESVLSQSYRNFEFIICDDSSIDGTHDYLQSVSEQDERVRIIRNSCYLRSPAVSLGRCLQAASPTIPYVAWMSDNSVLLPDALKILYDTLASQPELDFVYGSLLVHSPNQKLQRIGSCSQEKVRKEIESSYDVLSSVGLLCKRALFENAGWFDASIVLHDLCEWDFLRRMVAVGSFTSVSRDVCERYVVFDEAPAECPDVSRDAVARRYIQLRDAAAWPLSLEVALYHPADQIPHGDWSRQELATLSLMMLEYYLSIADTQKAYQWSERLRGKLSETPWWLDRFRHSDEDVLRSSAAMGAAAGIVFAYGKLEEISRTHETKVSDAVSSAWQHRYSELEQRFQALQSQLSAERYQLADRCNSLLQRSPAVHRTLKQIVRYFERPAR